MAEFSSRRNRRILLQIDAATHCRETMGAAIDIAARIGGELHGVFIENSDLAAVGELDFIREFRLSSPTGHQLDRLTLQAQLRAMARSVQRQLERAARLRKISVGFQAITEDIWQAEGEKLIDADLIIVESTGRLHARNFRGRLASRSVATQMGRSTLLLKGGKNLTSDVVIICDSVIAVQQAVTAAMNLLNASPEKITLLPYGLSDEKQKELRKFAVLSREGTGEETKTEIHLASPWPVEAEKFVENLSPADCTVVLMAGGPFLEKPENLDQLLTSRHPILFIQ